MERNGFLNNISKNQRFTNTKLNSRTRAPSRDISTSRSNKSMGYPSTFGPHRYVKAFSDGGLPSKNKVCKIRQSHSTGSVPTQLFHQAAGLSTIDESFMQNRTPWIGNAFVNKKSKERRVGFNDVRDIMNKDSLISPEQGCVSAWKEDKMSQSTNESDSQGSTSQKTSQMSFHLNSAVTERQRPLKNKVYYLSDPSFERMREATSIYLERNGAFHKQRMNHLAKNIEEQHRAEAKRQMNETVQKSKEKHKKSILNMKELKNVRKKFWSEKKKRVSSTYVSVAALETPEVDRYAYGLPEEGKEYTLTKKKFTKGKTNYTEKWEESIKKAKSIVKVLNIREKVQNNITLPILKPLTSHAKRMKESKEVLDYVEQHEEEMENKNDSKERETEAGFNKTENELIARTLFDIASEVSSLQEASTDFDTDFEDL